MYKYLITTSLQTDTMHLESCSCRLGYKTKLLILVCGVLIYLIFGALVFRLLEEKVENEQISQLRAIRANFAGKINGTISGMHCTVGQSDMKWSFFVAH